MSDDEVVSVPAPARVGSNADLARRMDRMEQRQDNQETQLRELASVTAEIRLGVQHGGELSKLRFDAIEGGLNTQRIMLSDFIKRMEGLISGETQTAQSKQLLEEYSKFRTNTTERLDAIEDRTARIDAEEVLKRLKAQEDRALRIDSRNSGIFASFTGAKAVLLVGAAIASPVITIIAILFNVQQ